MPLSSPAADNHGLRSPSVMPRLHRILALALLAPAAAHPARPMITDDARTVDAKACQVEAWSRTNRGSRELWALPACNFTGKLELTLGGAVTREGGGSSTSDVILQGKTLFRPLETNGYGLGLAVGYGAHPADHDNRPLGDPYFYVPASFSFAGDRVVLHLNGGARHVRSDHQTRATWGIGSEILVAPRAFLIAETFGESRGNASYQAGLRIWLVPNRVQIDATYGNQYGNKPDARWFSVGLRLISPPFLR
jgi:hypothetical protein